MPHTDTKMCSVIEKSIVSATAHPAEYNSSHYRGAYCLTTLIYEEA